MVGESWGKDGIFGQGLGKMAFLAKVWGNGIFGQGLGKFGENGIFGQGLGMFGNIVIMIKDNPQKRTITEN